MERIEKENAIMYLENNQVVAEIDFTFNDNTITITKTFVDDSLRGQGIAKKLVYEVINLANKKKCSLEATCSYAKKVLESI